MIFIFNIWDVIRKPLTNSLHHFSRWLYKTTNQMLRYGADHALALYTWPEAEVGPKLGSGKEGLF
jgi:hypothetical protein